MLGQDLVFIKNLKPGDEFVTRSHVMSYKTYQMHRVSRLTKTQIVCEDGSRFRRKDGREVGGTGTYWRTRYIKEITPEIAHQNKVEDAAWVLKNVRWLEFAGVLEVYELWKKLDKEQPND